VSSVSYSLGRARRLVQGIRTDRANPPLGDLRSISDPEAFVWAILPHAARSFAISILFLTETQARAAAVAYLYARMLDTYEDLSPSYEASRESLSDFADRFDSFPPAPAPRVPTPVAPSGPEQAHLLLIKRHQLVDSVFAQLRPSDQASIVRMIQAMAASMQSFSVVFEKQGGVLERRQQVLDYCRGVIGLPALFVMDMMTTDRSDDLQAEALQVSELIQLANITRDVEKDLKRGVAYHPSLRPFLGSGDTGPDIRAAVNAARRELVILGSRRAPSYRRLMERVDLPRFSSARAAAVLMMLFTWQSYRTFAHETDLKPPKRTWRILASSVLASISPSWADHALTKAEEGLLSIG